jgi:hypothetical protein
MIPVSYILDIHAENLNTRTVRETIPVTEFCAERKCVHLEKVAVPEELLKL